MVQKQVVRLFINSLHGLSLLAIFIFPQIVFSEHEADHRYTILGYVLDTQKKAIENTEVKVLLDGRLISQKSTDSRGFYKAKLHLHDPDYGKVLNIMTASGKGEVKIVFNPGDKETERLHYVNFIGGQLSEGEMSVSGFPQWVYFAAGGLLLFITLIAVSSKSKGKKRKKKK